MELNQAKIEVCFPGTLLKIFWLILHPILWVGALIMVSAYTSPVSKIIFLVAGLVSFAALLGVFFGSSSTVRKESGYVAGTVAAVAAMVLSFSAATYSATDNFPGESLIDKRAAAIQQAPGGQFRGQGATGSIKP